MPFLALVTVASMLVAGPAAAGAGEVPSDPIRPNDFVIPDDPELPTEPVNRAGTVVIDVAVVYTNGLKAALGSKAAVEALIADGIIFTNHALAASETKVQLRLVAVKKLKGYSTAGHPLSDLNNLRGASSLAPARALRVKKGADLVMMLTHVNYGGIAELLGPYSVTGYAGNYTPIIMAHEWGHNFGAGHDKPAGCGAQADACGYDAPDGSFRDLMSYGVECGGCTRIPFYSNPDVRFSWAKVPVHAGNESLQDTRLDNAVFGYDTSMANATISRQRIGKLDKANNARVMLYYGPYVAAWRPRVVPNGPTCMGIPATWVGTEGPDVFLGTRKRDVVVARGGDDEIHGAGGSDVICGGDGADQIFGDDGEDFLYGEGGDDWIEGGPGGDFIDGGPNNDHLEGGDGEDVLSGGGGHDTLLGGAGDDHLDGGKGDDTLAGGTGQNRLAGRAGNDQLYAEGELDYLQPGTGTNTVTATGNPYPHVLSFEDTAGPLTADLSTGNPATADLTNGAGTTSIVDLLLSLLIGSRSHDQITVEGDYVGARGLAGNDVITGNGYGWWGGLYGDSGNDVLTGSESSTYVDGGSGTDQCIGWQKDNCES